MWTSAPATQLGAGFAKAARAKLRNPDLKIPFHLDEGAFDAKANLGIAVTQQGAVVQIGTAHDGFSTSH